MFYELNRKAMWSHRPLHRTFHVLPNCVSFSVRNMIVDDDDLKTLSGAFDARNTNPIKLIFRAPRAEMWCNYKQMRWKVGETVAGRFERSPSERKREIFKTKKSSRRKKCYATFSHYKISLASLEIHSVPQLLVRSRLSWKYKLLTVPEEGKLQFYFNSKKSSRFLFQFFFSFVSQKKEENVSRFRPSFLSNLSSFHKSNKIWTQILCVVFVCVFCVVQLKSNAIQLNLMILEKLFILAFPLESLLQLLLLVFFSYSINRLQNNSCRCETNFVSLINIYSVKLFNRVDGGDTRNKKKILSDKEKLRKLFLLRLVFFSFVLGL